MDNLNLVSTFAEFKELKNIDKSTMIGVLEDVFRHLLIKTYETDENFDVIINPEKGDLEIWRNRTIVEDGTVENPNQQISLTDARKIDSTYEVGEEVAEEIKLADFGRRASLRVGESPGYPEYGQTVLVRFSFSYLEGHLVMRLLARKESCPIPPSTMTSAPGLKVSGTTPLYSTQTTRPGCSASRRRKRTPNPLSGDVAFGHGAEQACGLKFLGRHGQRFGYVEKVYAVFGQARPSHITHAAHKEQQGQDVDGQRFFTRHGGLLKRPAGRVSTLTRSVT